MAKAFDDRAVLEGASLRQGKCKVVRQRDTWHQGLSLSLSPCWAHRASPPPCACSPRPPWPPSSSASGAPSGEGEGPQWIGGGGGGRGSFTCSPSRAVASALDQPHKSMQRRLSAYSLRQFTMLWGRTPASQSHENHATHKPHPHRNTLWSFLSIPLLMSSVNLSC